MRLRIRRKTAELAKRTLDQRTSEADPGLSLAMNTIRLTQTFQETLLGKKVDDQPVSLSKCGDFTWVKPSGEIKLQEAGGIQ